MKMMMLLAAAALTVATGASAQMTSTKPAAATKPAPAAKPAATVSGNKVTTTTSTGKKITYDCSKKGNLNKKACKKG